MAQVKDHPLWQAFVAFVRQERPEIKAIKTLALTDVEHVTSKLPWAHEWRYFRAGAAPHELVENGHDITATRDRAMSKPPDDVRWPIYSERTRYEGRHGFGHCTGVCVHPVDRDIYSDGVPRIEIVPINSRNTLSAGCSIQIPLSAIPDVIARLEQFIPELAMIKLLAERQVQT